MRLHIRVSIRINYPARIDSQLATELLSRRVSFGIELRDGAITFVTHQANAHDIQYQFPLPRVENSLPVKNIQILTKNEILVKAYSQLRIRCNQRIFWVNDLCELLRV